MKTKYDVIRTELRQLKGFGARLYFPALWEDINRRWHRRNWSKQ